MPFWRSSAATRWPAFAPPTTRTGAGWGRGDGRRGLMVALTAGPDVLLARLGADGGGRPLLAPDPRARVQTLLAERAPQYAEADLILDAARPAALLAREILAAG